MDMLVEAELVVALTADGLGPPANALTLPKSMVASPMKHCAIKVARAVKVPVASAAEAGDCSAPNATTASASCALGRIKFCFFDMVVVSVCENGVVTARILISFNRSQKPGTGRSKLM
jgi:hypothetical protein